VRAQLFAVGLLAGLLGAGVALAVAAVSGGLGDTETVVRDRSAPDTTVSDPAPTTSARPLTGNGFDPAAIYAARATGVVTVYAEIPGRGRSQGSGFVIDDEGTVLTSAHVITSAGTSPDPRGAESVVLEFHDGERVGAEIVGWDLFSDTGVLRAEELTATVEPVPLGDSSAIAVGDPVAAIGSPFGNQGSLAVGVVSAIGRSVPALTADYAVTDAIQIDAPINRGNSGGPLFDARGQVIGINAQIRSDTGLAEGVGFAVPINTALRSREQLEQTGEVAYAYVGIRTEDVTPGMSEQFDLGAMRGALITVVSADSPAERAELRAGSDSATYQGFRVTLGGDLIVAIGGAQVEGAADVARTLTDQYLPGDRVEFTIVRDGERMDVPVVLDERPEQPRD
jgi:S1-C subfamily serine protease